MRRSLIPLGIFLALLVLLGVGLGLNPRLVPSPLIDQPAPAFQLPTLKDPTQQFSNGDLQGKVSLLNVWATWCVSCRQEHQVLMDLARSGQVDIYGLNYKDQRAEAIRWLQRLGDPYLASAYDEDGRVGIDWGVYGTPETFVVDTNGTIRYKHIGPLTYQDVQDKILPLVRELKAGQAG